MPILFFAFVLLTIVLWGWAIIDVTKSSFKSWYQSLLWLTVILLCPIFGSIVYFQLKRKLMFRGSGPSWTYKRGSI